MGFIALGLMMAGILLVHAWVLPRHEVHKRPIPLLGRQLTRPSAVAPFVVVALALACEHRFGWFRRNVLDLAPVRAVPREGWIGVGLLLSLCAIALVGRRLRPGSSPYLAAFSEFLAQPRSALILAFVISFRTGESFLQKMKWPFFRDCIQLSLESYGVASGTFGVIASFTGTLVGGFLIARYGLRRWIWPFVIAQNGLHLLYVLLAVWGSTGRVDFVTVTAIISIEHLGEGLGTAVFTVFLMRCCDPRHKAAHMAIVTAIMSIGFTVAGMVSGYLAQALGFVRYFFFTFVVTIPSMAMIFFLPYLDGRPKREQG
jgi:PAT family beta-lactamase induction signal transducer AmpG